MAALGSCMGVWGGEGQNKDWVMNWYTTTSRDCSGGPAPCQLSWFSSGGAKPAAPSGAQGWVRRGMAVL